MKPGLHLRKQDAARIFATLLITLMVATASLFARRSQNAAPDGRPAIRFVRNPDPAPEFHLKTLDGHPLALGSSQGKVVLLNFWATWCGPCRAEIPDLIALQTKYKDNLQIIGLVIDSDDDAEVRDIVRNESINYPVAISSDQVRAEYGGIGALPTLFVLDTQGRVVQKHVGLRDPVLYEVEVRALLGLPVPVNVERFEDTGEIFLKHADRASELPGVDLSKLSAEQRTVALHNFNAESCSCGCKYTLAQCRIYDHNCKVSKDRIGKILDELTKSKPSMTEPVPAGLEQ
jgi:cytochrome c biogenesis protein CcmG/thiol:disulfide interchange protein DsbE